jgi:hypothetical protein
VILRPRRLHRRIDRFLPRFLFGGSYTALAGLIAKRYGPEVSQRGGERGGKLRCLPRGSGVVALLQNPDVDSDAL